MPKSSLIAETTPHLAIRESGYRQGTRAVVPEGNGQKIRIRLMGWEPGATVVEGSSADYPVDRIIRDFPETFPIGTRMRANHDSVCDAGGDVRRIMAKTISTPEAEDDGMYADAIVREGEPAEFVRAFADVIGTSISAGAQVEMEVLRDEDGEPILEDGKPVMITRRSERGVPIVERFLSMKESPYNSIDFVEVPGADGAIVQLALESAKQIVEHTMLREASGFAIDLAGKREKTSLGAAEGNKPGVTSAQEKEAIMEKKDIDALAAAIVESLAPVMAPVKESRAAAAEEAQAKVDAEAIEAAVEERLGAYEEALAAIEAADLLKPQVVDLKRRARRGEDITEALASAKEVAEAATKRAEDAADGGGYVHRSAEARKGSTSGLIIKKGGRR